MNAADHLYIGLREGSNSEGCSCLNNNAACTECRNRFGWVDGTTVNNRFSPWADHEPQIDESCASLTNQGEWNGTPCDVELDYVCYRGTT